MISALTGFLVIGFAILVGYIVARVGLLGPHARHVLSRLVFYVLSPALLFVVLAQADVRTLFSSLLPVSAVTAAVIFAVYVLLAGLLWKRRAGDLIIGTLSAGQVNSNNIGIPLSLYLLGDAAYPAPVILMQVVVMTPIALALLDVATSQGLTVRQVLSRVIGNPIVIASVLGAVVSASGLALPRLVLDPLQLVAGACIPLLLISYGMSLHGQRVLGAVGRRRDVILASTLKLVAMPAVAWALGDVVFGLRGESLLAVVVLAALPTAQNVFNFSQRYDVGESIARDTILITTVGCVPVLLLVLFLLGGR